MKIRRKNKPRRALRSHMAWVMATAAMMHWSAAAPESAWAKEPNQEDPLNPRGPLRPDRWGRDSDQPLHSDERWRTAAPSSGRLFPDGASWLAAQFNDKTIEFDIAPQPLESALQRFGEQAAVQFAYTTDDVQGLRTQGVRGTYTAEEALQFLLDSTGIGYRTIGATTIALEKRGVSSNPLVVAEPVGQGPSARTERAQAAAETVGDGKAQKPVKVPEIVVKEAVERAPVVDSPDGYKADVSSEAVLRFPASIQELPMSVSVVTKDSIRERRAVTQQQAMEGVAGVGKNPQFGGLQVDNYMLRGFFANGQLPGYTRDNGLWAFNNYVGDTALYERIEVIKGPATFTSGLVSAGGFVNRLLKAPEKQNFVVAEAGAGSYGHYRTTLDANGVMPNLPLAGRFVMTYNDDPEFFRNTGNQRLSFLPSVRLATDNDFTLTVTGNVQRLRGKGHYGTPTTIQGTIPAGIEDSLLGRNNNLKLDYHSLHVEADKQFAQGLRLKARGQYSHDSTSYRYAYAYQSGGIGPDGNFSVYGYGRDFKRESWAGEVNLTKEFSLFGSMNSIAIGMDYSIGRQLTKRKDFASLGAGNVASPDVNVPFPDGFTDSATVLAGDLRYQQTGAFLQGLIRPFSGTTIMLALRHNWITQQAEAPFIAGGVGRRGLNESKLTPQIGLSQHIAAGLNLYAAYGESITQNLALTADGSLLSPLNGKSVEVGGKWEPPDHRIRLTAAVFRTELDNVASPDPAFPPNSGISIGGQSQRNQGFELEAQGALLPQLRLSLAYTYLDTELTKSTVPGFVGSRAFNTPAHTVSAFGSYDLSELVAKGLKFGAVIYYRSDASSFPPAFQNQIFDAYARADLFAIYAPTKWLSFQLNLNNLADARYVEGPNRFGAYNQFGAPRHVIGMVRMTF